jgi:hypothetical protein
MWSPNPEHQSGKSRPNGDAGFNDHVIALTTTQLLEESNLLFVKFHYDRCAFGLSLSTTTQFVAV